MTRNISTERNPRLVVAWTVEFQRLKKREKIPLILLIILIAWEVVKYAT